MILFACSPKMKAKVNQPHPPLPENTPVVILQKEDNFTNDGIEIGTIKAGEKGLSANCTYNEVVGQLRQLARKNGANLIKITKRKNPDNWSTCVRLTAKIYNVPDSRKHEKEIEWSPSRKLTWEDFKGEPRTSLDVGAESACGFFIEINQATVFNKPKLATRTTFDCSLSWVNTNQKGRQDLLQHEQAHFDLCEIYARRLKKRLIENKLTGAKIKRDLNTIFMQVHREYVKRQNAYDRETDFSRNSEKQAEWLKIINDELQALNSYSQQQPL